MVLFLLQVVGPISLLYVGQREFAVTHPHDNRISILGTDDVTTGIIIVVRHTGKKLIIECGHGVRTVDLAGC